ncbi:hypothetical protein FRC03_001092 [Tulasnella sp. 419]|nr:hypothetical protein FRC03_001092 [Tulasnella sp. 419]
MTRLTLHSLVRAMSRIAPPHLAESWDNVGLIVESPIVKPDARRILLTIDLTPEVLEEAIHPLKSTTAAIIAYHPPIFKGLKSLTLDNPLQSSLLRCITNGISVWSPHTALDSVKGGINDWLAEGLITHDNGTVSILGEEKQGLGAEGAGVGRRVDFDQPVPLEEIVVRVKKHLRLGQVQLAKSAFGPDAIRSVAICAGSGSSVVGSAKADLYFTGEMSHHEVLAAIASGTHTILCGHTNTERGYLPTLKKRLEDELAQEDTDRGIEGLPKYEVAISEADRHPLDII